MREALHGLEARLSEAELFECTQARSALSMVYEALRDERAYAAGLEKACIDPRARVLRSTIKTWRREAAEMVSSLASMPEPPHGRRGPASRSTSSTRESSTGMKNAPGRRAPPQGHGGKENAALLQTSLARSVHPVSKKSGVANQASTKKSHAHEGSRHRRLQES